MIWIQTLVVVFLVTTRTGIGRVLIVAIMTRGAVLGNGNMGPINDPIIIMLWKFCRTPTWICCMTGGTIGRKSQCTMVRIDRLIVIRQMTSRTVIGGIVVIPVMAQGTFIRNGDMSPFDDPKIIVNRKCSRTPSRICGVTSYTIGRKAQGQVIGIAGLIEILEMACITIHGCSLIASCMAFDARNGYVGTC